MNKRKQTVKERKNIEDKLERLQDMSFIEIEDEVKKGKGEHEERKK